jgi:hypothetical protein
MAVAAPLPFLPRTRSPQLATTGMCIAGRLSADDVRVSPAPCFCSLVCSTDDGALRNVSGRSSPSVCPRVPLSAVAPSSPEQSLCRAGAVWLRSQEGTREIWTGVVETEHTWH